MEIRFENEILVRHAELKTHPVVEDEPPKTTDALHGGRTGAMRLHYTWGVQVVRYPNFFFGNGSR